MKSAGSEAAVIFIHDRSRLGASAEASGSASMASQRGPRTADQKTADAILRGLEDYRAKIGANTPKAVHGLFPVSDSGLAWNGKKVAACGTLIGK